MVSIARADTKSLAMEKQCLYCHTLSTDKRSAIQVNKAPDFKSIAERYKGQANVKASLALKIKNGGIDHWGSTPMPLPEGHRADVSDDEAKELASWILEQH
jgi:cytochrome c551/c552